MRLLVRLLCVLVAALLLCRLACFVGGALKLRKRFLRNMILCWMQARLTEAVVSCVAAMVALLRCNLYKQRRTNVRKQYRLVPFLLVMVLSLGHGSRTLFRRSAPTSPPSIAAAAFPPLPENTVSSAEQLSQKRLSTVSNPDPR